NWVAYPDFATVTLDAGIQVLKFAPKSQHLNYDYLQFSLMLPGGGVDDGSGSAGGSSGAGGAGGASAGSGAGGAPAAGAGAPASDPFPIAGTGGTAPVTGTAGTGFGTAGSTPTA